MTHPRTLTWTLACTLLFASACADEPALAPEPGEELAGGATTVYETGARAFMLSARNLDVAHEIDFFVGNSFFNKNWVITPSSSCTAASRTILPASRRYLAAPRCSASCGRSTPASVASTMLH